jgi:hypothetical protein
MEQDRMIPLVFISGPYTNPDPVSNTHNAVLAAERIEDLFNVGVFIPHLSLLWHIVHPAPIEAWYGRDLHILERCDAVYRMQGESTGADREVTHAKLFEIPVFFADDPMSRMIDWREAWKPKR